MKKILKKSLLYILSSYYPKYADSESGYDIGICALVCHEDVLRFICSVSSLFYQLKTSLPLYVVDDGTLTPMDKTLLNKQFNITIDSSTDQKMKLLLKNYKYLQAYRFSTETEILKKKFDAMLLHPFKKFIYLDSDILFYKKPEQIHSFIYSNANLNYYTARDVEAYKRHPNLYSFDSFARLILIKYYRKKINPFFNSGLLCLQSKSEINLNKLDRIFKLFIETKYVPNGQNEETALALCMPKDNSLLLSVDTYGVATLEEEYLDFNASNVVAMHYSGNSQMAMEKIFYRDALWLSFITKNFSTYHGGYTSLLRTVHSYVSMHKKFKLF